MEASTLGLGQTKPRDAMDRITTSPDLDHPALALAFRRLSGAAGPAPDLAARRKTLAALAQRVRAHEDRLIAAVDADFGGRPAAETRLLELLPLYDQIAHARRHLRGWMRRRRVAGSRLLWPARAFYEYQPLGVVGVIGAWNYPVLLTLGPAVDALAAGNRVLVKPSELAPRTAEALAVLVAEAFPADQVAVVTGDADLARAMTRLPLDHLVFTGSTRVGREVMRAAAENLTPVTLELGGKSPAILHDSADLARAVPRLMAGKLMNAGQTCVAPDYALVPPARMAEFEAETRRAVAAMFPQGLNGDYARIISDRHLARLQGLVAEARANGARVVELAPVPPGANGRLMPPTLVFDPPEDGALMREEIFGPVLPVLPAPTLDAALDFVNARPRPLALYYFDDDRARQDEVLARTMSGGLTFNDCLFHVGQLNLPFGGVGDSGMGAYHGFDGFARFSKKRPVMVQPRWAATALACPPWAARRRLVAAMLAFARRGTGA